MGFLGVYRALYDYIPTSEGELAIKEGSLVFVLEKEGDDDWWRAKRKATDDEEEEPEGLIPSNYVEEAQPTHHAKALYDYGRQTDEEISFAEEATLQVYDETDPDWTLVGFNGEFGFAPSNYIEKASGRPSLPPRSPQDDESSGFSSPAGSPIQSPAAALAGLIQQRTGPSSSGPVMSPPRAQTYTPDASDDEDNAPPSLPQRPSAASPSSLDRALPRAPAFGGSPSVSRSARDEYDEAAATGGIRMYHIHEMISHLGRNRKMPTAFGINVARGHLTIAPESGSQQEWTADKMTHYSLEGKHVFVELVRPSKSVDFHAGNKETASEIVSVLSELAGAVRAEGLREVLAVSNGVGGPKKGQMLYEFMAQGEDEVTVAVGDEVIILDDSQSEEWWKVRRLKNGKEGVVPSSYVEITGTTSASAGASGATAGYSTVEQNRRDEQRMTMDAVRSSSQQEGSRRDRRKDSRSASTSKPNVSKTRQWTDRSGTFKVDAEFLGVKDGKIHLHKTNGVKIAVPAAKMSAEDIDYVERETGVSIGEDKPARQTEQRRSDRQVTSPPPGSSGAAVQQTDRPRYDWFDFFLQCGVAPQICERYTTAFERDQMTEENLQDINADVLRTLGLKEGDILRVTKFLDSKFSRSRPPLGSTPSTNGDGLFSGPDGGLKNNTTKGRPAPPVESNNTVDPRVFEQRKDQPLDGNNSTAPSRPPPTSSGFDDDAWDNKPSRRQTTSAPAPPPGPPPSQPQRPAPTGAMEQLSLLSPPLQPTIASQPFAPQQTTQTVQSQPTGADRTFFDQLGASSQTQQLAASRQRPQPPQGVMNQASMLPPPPGRPMSAPGTQPNAFQPQSMLRPQMTGLAAPGQSMNELNQQRMYQLYAQQTGFAYPQPNGMMPQMTGMNNFIPPQQQAAYPQMIQNQPTGFMPPMAPYQQPYLTAQPTGSPFADPPRAPFIPQPTGFAQPYLQAQPTGLNSYLPLVPQATGVVNGFGQPPSQLPSMQGAQNQTQGVPALAPLVPQKTGPPPPVRFGVTPAAKKLTAQPTGRRANLSHATPQNPFGF